MKPRTNGVSRAQKSKNFQSQGPNWILIAGGALLSTLSVRLGFKLKQALDTKQQENASNSLKGLVYVKHIWKFFWGIPAPNYESFVLFRQWEILWQKESCWFLPYASKCVFLYTRRWWLLQLYFRCLFLLQIYF